MTSLVAEAIYDDPFPRWRFPNPRLRTTKLRRALELDVRYRLNGRSIPFVVRHSGIAFWCPPEPPQPARSVTARFARSYLRTTGQHPIRSLRIVRREKRQGPSAPHWRLELLAVDPGHRRNGIGQMLMEAGLERADADGVGAFAMLRETGSWPFFEALGFTVTGTLHAPGTPDALMLWRPPSPSDLAQQPTTTDTHLAPASSREGGPRNAHHVDC
jgi:GNAT superfamily N-acetyltransferase